MKRLLYLCLVLCVTLFVVACEDTRPLGGALDEQELREIQEKITQHFDDIQEELGIEIQSIGTRKYDIFMTFRSLNAFGEKKSEEQLEELKQYLFELVGQEFPIELKHWTPAGEGDLKGKITDIDEARVLIVDRDQTLGQTGDPTATWVSFTDDAEIIFQETGEFLFFDDLTIGQRVEAWSTGMMLDSYPGQTAAVRLIIHETEKESEDILGEITMIKVLEDPHFGGVLIHISDQVIQVPDNTKVYSSEQDELHVEDLEEGQQVRVWYRGYISFGEDRKEVATQIVVE
jgi:hypothetical protein